MIHHLRTAVQKDRAVRPVRWLLPVLFGLLAGIPWPAPLHAAEVKAQFRAVLRIVPPPLPRPRPAAIARLARGLAVVPAGIGPAPASADRKEKRPK